MINNYYYLYNTNLKYKNEGQKKITQKSIFQENIYLD